MKLVAPNTVELPIYSPRSDDYMLTYDHHWLSDLTVPQLGSDYLWMVKIESKSEMPILARQKP